MDNNAKVMRNCDQNIAKLKEENKMRDAEIERKKRQLKILQDKRERIEQQKKAVEQYQTFLENVRNQNNDDFAEVVNIRMRYKTLDQSQKDLMKGSEEMSRRLEEKKSEVQNYERTMENKIMSLNNDIANLTVVCDNVEA